jgi:hypothetical protein
MSDVNNMRAIQMGALARNALVEGCSGKIMGLTSKGMFLNTGDSVFFVTEASYKSPFNIQIGSMAAFDDKIKPGDAWFFSQDHINYDNLPLRIGINEASVWKPSDPLEADTELYERAARMGVILRRMHALDTEKGWLFLTDLGSWFGNAEKTYIYDITAAFLDAVEASDMQASLESVKPILGRGGGLTPSGDDWLSGFLLYFARLKKQTPFLIEFGSALSKLAYERTTKISANRIEAACQGWAEELFLDLLDHLFCEERQPFADEKVDYLVNFGHSSGVDTCVGFYSALCSDLPKFE